MRSFESRFRPVESVPISAWNTPLRAVRWLPADAGEGLQSEEGPRIIKYEEELAPDVTAIKYWLGNRQPEKWRDRSSKEISGPGRAPIEISNMTDLETARRSAFAITRLLLSLPTPPDEDDNAP